jgi:hypothetical protein
MDDGDDNEPSLDLDVLRQEAGSLGLHYTGSSGPELHGLISLARAKRGGGPVRCYGLSYDPTDPRCRVCQLRNPCADLDKRPRVEMVNVQLQFLHAVPCGACGAGVLNQELLDPETRETRDYGCSTKGCHNTVSIQCGFDKAVPAAKSEPITEIVLGTPLASVPSSDSGPAPVVPASGANGASAAPELRIVRTPRVRAKAAPKPKKPEPPPKPPAKAPAARKAAPAKGKPPVPPPAPPPAAPKTTTMRTDLRYRYQGNWYSSLLAAVQALTGNKAWNSMRLFGVKVADLKAGQVLKCELKGVKHEVEVHESE